MTQDTQLKRITKKEFIELLKEKNGVVTDAIAASNKMEDKKGIARKTFYRWKEKDPKFAEKASEIQEAEKEKMDDYAEGKLFQAIKEGNMTAIIFYLKTRNIKYRLKHLLELEGKLQVEGKLNKEEKELLCKALNYARVTEEDNREQELPKGTGEK